MLKTKFVSLLVIAVVAAGMTFYVARSNATAPVASQDLTGNTPAAQSTTQNQTSSAAPPSLFTVMIYGADEGAYFSPQSVTLSVGAKVTWVNSDTALHTVTSYNATSAGKPFFDSGTMASGQTFSYVFTGPGAYRYYCAFHTWMQGTIIVEAPGS